MLRFDPSGNPPAGGRGPQRGTPGSTVARQGREPLLRLFPRPVQRRELVLRRALAVHHRLRLREVLVERGIGEGRRRLALLTLEDLDARLQPRDLLPQRLLEPVARVAGLGLGALAVLLREPPLSPALSPRSARG